MQKIKLIIALNKNGQIGFSDGALPWHFSTDLKYFRTVTQDSILVIGYNTYLTLVDKFPKGLPRRETYVLTSRDGAVQEPFLKISTIAEISALKDAKPEKDIFIAGGARLYDQVLSQDLCDELLITCIQGFETSADIKISPEYPLFDYFNFIELKNLIGVQYQVSGLETKTDINSQSGKPYLLEFVTLEKVSKS